MTALPEIIGDLTRLWKMEHEDLHNQLSAGSKADSERRLERIRVLSKALDDLRALGSLEAKEGKP